MQKIVNNAIDGKKTFWKWAKGQNIYDFEKDIDPRGYSVHVYNHQVHWYIFEISGERVFMKLRPQPH